MVCHPDGMTVPRVDVHQHVWPAPLVAALRARTRAPRLVGWTLYLDGEPPYEVRPEDHSIARRAELAAQDGIDLVLVSLSSPLGIESLPAADAAGLLDAYHEGVLALPRPFGAWAAASVDDPDPAALREVLGAGCVGLQLPATALADADGYARCAPLLDELDRVGAPLFVHPGPAAADPSAPPWWPAMVSYVAQMHTAWFAWHEYGPLASPDCAWGSRCSPDSRRCTPTGWLRAADRRRSRRPKCSSTPRRTVPRSSRPWRPDSAPTASCSARTARTQHRCCSATSATSPYGDAIRPGCSERHTSENLDSAASGR